MIHVRMTSRHAPLDLPSHLTPALLAMDMIAHITILLSQRCLRLHLSSPTTSNLQMKELKRLLKLKAASHLVKPPLVDTRKRQMDKLVAITIGLSPTVIAQTTTCISQHLHRHAVQRQGCTFSHEPSYPFETRIWSMH
jgi:hypothetical protein